MSMNKNIVLKVEDLKRHYTVEIDDEEIQTISVLKGLSFDVCEGEFVGIMGRSGCGKTTLLKTLGLIAQPNGGDIWYRDKKVSNIYGDDLAEIRRKELGFIFQDFYLMDSLSILENIMMPLIFNEDDIAESKKKAMDIAEKFQVDHLLHKKPYEISGGEKQRTAICRTLVADPGLIFGDEPTGNLDSKSAKVVIEALSEINKQLGKTIVLVTHDPIIASYCSRIIFLKDGQIMGDLCKGGTNDEFYLQVLEKMKEL